MRPLTSGRIDLVDALRGYALIGLFLVHIEEHYELFWAAPQPTRANHIVFALFMGKTFSLLALCFGFSFHVMLESARRSGEAFALRFCWRLTLLGLIGSLHGLLYRSDITVVLALAGFVLIPADCIRRNRTLLAVATLCLLQPYLLVWIAVDFLHEPTVHGIGHRTADATMQAYLNGSLSDVVRANLVAGQIAKWWFLVSSGRLAEIVGLFLIGLLLGRIGFFATPGRFRRARTVAFVVCLAVLALTRLLHPHVPQGAEALSLLGTVMSTWSDLAQMGASILIIMLLWEEGGDRLLSVLAPVGQMSLTLYIAQSLLFVPMFYGFGMGLHARASETQDLILGLAAAAAQVIFANLWFRVFHFGPLEWLWRCGTRLTLDVSFRRHD